ncbi:MAG: hypothetical protein HRT68_01235 [Flavobacteriaceae bacterium]|nr:hypothetical protein [Flavobacteriaceae bacterium]
MKMHKLFIVVLTAIFIFSCSSDDDNSNNNQNVNGFTFNGTFYSAPQVFLNDENTTDNSPSDLAIIMSNVNLLTANQNSGVNFVYFDFNGVTFETATVTVIPDYNIIENGAISNLQVTGGTTVLDDTQSGLTATSTSVTINSFTASSINFTFSFTREDGEVITGNYSGSYTDISGL